MKFFHYSILILAYGCATAGNMQLGEIPKSEEALKSSLEKIGSIPELSAVTKDFCTNETSLSGIGNYIKFKIADKSWEEVQGELIKTNTPESIEESKNLQKARAVIASCAKELYGAVPTGSARNLAEIDTKNALKDIDMSVPLENVESSNIWLKKIVPDPDRMMLVTLLGDPIAALPCKEQKGKHALSCARANALETAHILLINEIRNSAHKDSHSAPMSKLANFCPSGFILPPEKSFVYSFFEAAGPDEEKKFTEGLPASPTKESKYRSSTRYRILFNSVKNPAYYMQPGSIKRWVIDREKDFSEKLAKDFPDYVSNRPVQETEREGALFEQMIHSLRHEESFYYRWKYFFRAVDHAGLDSEKDAPEISAIHKVLKKTRPAKIEEVHSDLMKAYSAGALKDFKSLSFIDDKYSIESLKTLIASNETRLKNSVRDFINSRKTKKSSIFPALCKELP